MSETKKPAPPNVAPASKGPVGGLFHHVQAAAGVTSPGGRPKRRRKGQLNDGEWAPGYGPDAKKTKPK
ncbi:hypothetical protein [Terricaulis sp.]|uniref:hypothetical protein n=1 Tax=Terricaulis sp. TaxID=2768686 RepID=UPI0037851850